MVATRCITVSAVASSKVADIHGCVHGIYIGKVGWASLNGPLPVMINIDGRIHVLVVAIALDRHAVLVLDGVARSPVLPLFTKFGLCNSLDVRVGVGGVLARGVHA